MIGCLDTSPSLARRDFFSSGLAVFSISFLRYLARQMKSFVKLEF